MKNYSEVTPNAKVINEESLSADQWQKQGQLTVVNGHKHFVYDSDNDKPPLLILHGYPTCTYDYHKVLPLLENLYRVVMHDHLGFGFSDKPLDYSYSLMEQADQALLLWQQLGISEGVVLAHDYGTSVVTEILARQQRFKNSSFTIKQLVLCNGSMHVEMAQLRFIQKLLLNPWIGPWVSKLSSRRTLAKNLKNTFGNPSLISTVEIDALWEMMTHNQGRKVLYQTTQYIKQRYTHWHRWIGALQSTDLLVHIIWAEADPVAVVQMAHTLHHEINNSQLKILAHLGHFPMLENPSVWASTVLESLQK